MRMTKVVIVAALAVLLAAAAQSQTPKPTPRPTPQPTPWPNKPPSVKLVPSVGTVTLARCGEGEPADPFCPATSPKVKLSARATDPDGDTMLYTYSTTGGRVSGEGPEVTLDLTGVVPGAYSVTVEVDDGNGGIATDAANVTVERCTCDPPPPPPCPTVTVSCPDTPGRDKPVVFTANVSGGDPNVTPTFNWKVSAGKIVSGQGTGSITVETNGMRDWVTATVDVGGYDRGCSTSNSCTNTPGDPPTSRKIDEYGDIPLGKEQQRLDSIAVELQNDPASQTCLICYGGKRSGPRAAMHRCERAKNYLISSRGIEVRRVFIIDGGHREGLTVEVWIVPSGATRPQPSPHR